MKIDAATATVLVPGSIWTRERKGKVVPVTVLLITNEGLDEEILERHPQQVVFLTQTLKVQSMDIETFLSVRNYSTMDTDREDLLKALVSPIEDPEDQVDIDDIDSIQLPEDSGEQDGLPDLGADEEGPDGQEVVLSQQPSQDEVIDLNAVARKPYNPPEVEEDEGPLEVENESKQFVPSKFAIVGLGSKNERNVGFEIPIDHPYSSLLADRFVSYAETPIIAGDAAGDTMHTIAFEIDDKLTLDNLRDIFAVARSELEISGFTVKSPVEVTSVTIDSFIEVTLEVTRFGVAGLVQITSSGSYRASHDQTAEEAIDLTSIKDATPAAPVAAPAPQVQVIEAETAPNTLAVSIG